MAERCNSRNQRSRHTEMDTNSPLQKLILYNTSTFETSSGSFIKKLQKANYFRACVQEHRKIRGLGMLLRASTQAIAQASKHPSKQAPGTGFHARVPNCYFTDICSHGVENPLWGIVFRLSRESLWHSMYFLKIWKSLWHPLSLDCSKALSTPILVWTPTLPLRNPPCGLRTIMILNWFTKDWHWGTWTKWSRIS